MTDSGVLDKVRKLLRLSSSNNANEAALAAAKAQELIDRHNLTTAMLSLDDAVPTSGLDDEPIRDFEDAPLDSRDRMDRWRCTLATTIGSANACKIYTQGSDLKIVGRPGDAETVRYMYGWLSREVERLATDAGNGMGRTWRNNFRLGVVDTIARKLREQREAFEKTVRAEARAEGNPMALMRVDRGLSRIVERKMEVSKWVKENMSLRTITHSATNYNHNARQAGRKAGESINVGGARTGIGRGTTRGALNG